MLVVERRRTGVLRIHGGERAACWHSAWRSSSVAVSMAVGATACCRRRQPAPAWPTFSTARRPQERRQPRRTRPPTTSLKRLRRKHLVLRHATPARRASCFRTRGDMSEARPWPPSPPHQASFLRRMTRRHFLPPSMGSSKATPRHRHCPQIPQPQMRLSHLTRSLRRPDRQRALPLLVPPRLHRH